MLRKVSVVIPAKNEEMNIGLVLDDLNRTISQISGWEFEVILVDDKSADRTGELAQARGARVIRNNGRSGKGRALRLGFEAARAKVTAGAVLNAANEAAVEAFRAGRIGFTGIVAQAEAVVRRHTVIPEPTLEQLLEADRWARDAVGEEIERVESRE